MKRLLAIFALFLFGCASMRVTVNYDETMDFSQYKTFDFQQPGQQQRGRGIQNPLFNKDLMREIKPVMEGKGLQQVAPGENPDLHVIFYAAVRNRRDWVAPSYHVGRWGRVWRTSPGHVVHFKEGTLVIDMVDPKRQELVWQGIGEGVLNRDNPEQNFIDAVQKVLEDFPPKN